MANEKLTDQELMILAASNKPVVVLLSAELLAARKRIAELEATLEDINQTALEQSEYEE